MKQMAIDPIVRHETVYDLEGFTPRIVDRAYLEALGVNVEPSEETAARLIRGSEVLQMRLERGSLIPRPLVKRGAIDLESDLEVHNYTGACPTSTYELSPLRGCNVGCLYCLVSDGSHEDEMVLLENYPSLVEKVLEDKLGERCFYYFSPKTEAFQEPTLQSGVAHDILRAFIEHFDRHPRSQARIFVASKAGAAHLDVRHQGESVFDLFGRLRGRMQFNTSVSIMPEQLRRLLEPHAADIEDRLAAVERCQRAGIAADSALVQPIVIPSLTGERVQAFFTKLRRAKIINYKPEFLTVNMENLAMIGQLLGHFDADMERRLYELYISPRNADHTKQRERTAPDRATSVAVLEQMIDVAQRLGMSTSICYWVRKELGISEELIPLVNSNGFQCLGYQTRLFDEDPLQSGQDPCP